MGEMIVSGGDWAVQARSLLAGMNPRTRKVYVAAYRRYRAWCRSTGWDPGAEASVYGYFESWLAEGPVAKGSVIVEFSGILKIARLCGATGWDAGRMKELRRGLLRRCESGEGAPAMTLHDLRAALAVASPVGRVLLLLGYGGGFRVSELLGLRGEDVSVEAGMVRVRLRESKGDRAGEGVVVYVGPFDGLSPAEELSWLVAGPGELPVQEPEGSRRLFGMAETAFRRWWKALMREAGLARRGLTPHSLRVGCATAAVEGGVALPVLQKHLRHKSATTTARYYRSRDARLNGLAVGAGLGRSS